MSSGTEAALAPRRAPRAPRFRLPRCLAAVAVGLLLSAIRPAVAAGGDATLFRIILNDGTAVTAYGEYARVGDRVVFSMPLGTAGTEPRLQLVSLPAASVNWESTDRYADAVRYARYVETRGEEDYARLTGEIALALNEISLATDDARRLELAVAARRTLVDWPRAHFGYRSTDIRDMVALLDEAISGLRAAAGAEQFDLSFVAVVDPPAVPLLPAPTLAQMIEQALAVARVTDNSAERSSLLRSAIAVIDQSQDALPRDWAKRTRAAAAGTLQVETKADKAYAQLARRAMASAKSSAAAADVRGVDRVLLGIRQSDRALGGTRPEEIRSLIAAVEERLDAARRLRLARDRWALRAGVLLDYRDRVEQPLKDFEAVKDRLADIRSFAGPSPRVLTRVGRSVSGVLKRLKAIVPPEELETQHAMLVSACHLAAQAVEARGRAVRAEDMKLAWDASSAAAGSMMLLARARAEMQGTFRPPQLR